MIPNRLLFVNPMQQPVPSIGPGVNMLASADFAPDSMIAKMLAAQRAAEAKQAAQKTPPKPVNRMETADEVLKRRMREAGLE